MCIFQLYIDTESEDNTFKNVSLAESRDNTVTENRMIRSARAVTMSQPWLIQMKGCTGWVTKNMSDTGIVDS